MTLEQIQRLLEIPLPQVERRGKDGDCLLTASTESVMAMSRSREIAKRLLAVAFVAKQFEGSYQDLDDALAAIKALE